MSTSLSSDDQLTQFFDNFVNPAGGASAAQQTQIDALIQLYPDDPAQGSPYGTGSNIFGLGSEYKRAASMAGDIWFHSIRRAWNQAASAQGVPVFAYLFTDPQASGNPSQGGESCPCSY